MTTERSNLYRRAGLFLAAGVWVFLLLAVGSYTYMDPPSHQVYPYGPVRNVCGIVGSYVAYGVLYTIGPGIFPILFFSGVLLALVVFRSRVSDLWLRAIGLFLLSLAFAALINNFKQGSWSSPPEGYGGILGIGASHFLQTHFNTVGTRLILAVTIFVGLLLAADDLVLRTPAFVGATIGAVKQAVPGKSWRLPRLSLASIPFVARLLARNEDKETRRLGDKETKDRLDEDELAEFKRPVLLKPNPLEEQDVHLSYPEDDHPTAAPDAAFVDAADPAPSEAAIVPPVEQQAPVPPPVERKDIVVRLPSTVRTRQTAPPPPKELGEYHTPGWDLLAEAEHGFAESQEKYVREKAAILEQALKEFQIAAQVVEIDTGPVITMYELSLAPGIKVSQITALSNDIARALMAVSVRIVAPVPGKNTVGIEVPNPVKEKVRLKELMQTAPEAMHKMTIPLFLGKDASGEALITDLAAMPHCLIAGTTGSGKSVCINSILMSIMYTQRPDMVKLILVDPKIVEMAPFKDIPHLMCPVINETGRAVSVLEWACEKMDERYEILAEAGVRNIAGYNKLTREELMERFQPSSEEEEAKIPKHLPYIVIIVDELADLMMTSGKEVENFIVRLAQKSRAIGIHLILATQRPSANVVTGLIKSNMPSRIAFRVQSKMDSRIVLDQNGADLLLGQGDMLFMPPGASKPIRSQGTFIDDKEIRESVRLVKNLAEAQYEPELVQIKSKINLDGDMEQDDLFDDAVRIILETKRGSVSLLQRRLSIGYGRAARLIEMMAGAGLLGEYKGSQARECTMTIDEWETLQAARQADAESGMSV